MQTIWLSPTEHVTGEPTLQISYPSAGHPSTIVTCVGTPGDFKWISMGLRLPPNVSIEGVTICYQIANPDPGISPQSYISQVRLVEMGTPNQATVVHDDGTDLNATSPARYTSQVGGKVPARGTAVNL